MALSKRQRFSILRRDNFTCRYCGAKAPDVQLHVDHKKPVALGGDDHPANLVTACVGCNAGKSATPLDGVQYGPREIAALTADLWAYECGVGTRRIRWALQAIGREALTIDDLGETLAWILGVFAKHGTPTKYVTINAWLSCGQMDELERSERIA